MAGLEAFLQAAKARGASDEFLVALMKEHGWPPAEVYLAIGRHYAQVTGVPIPRAVSRMESAREAFFHLLAFATLASWIIATGSLWFALIDTWFPDPTRTYATQWGWQRLSWQMASIIVAFPAFVYATKTILDAIDENPDRAPSAIRRWLTNFALLIAALVSIGDLVAFVAAFLQGELTVRFVLQCLTLFILAGAVFLYYSRGSARSQVTPHLWHRGFAGAAAAAILVSLAIAFLKTGSPADQRLQAEDRRRVQDLHRIASRIHEHWERNNGAQQTRALPDTLEELTRNAQPGLVLNDPFSREPYRYLIRAAPAYQLCATFATETPTHANEIRPAWAHGTGNVCFDLDASQSPGYPAGIN